MSTVNMTEQRIWERFDRFRKRLLEAEAIRERRNNPKPIDVSETAAQLTLAAAVDDVAIELERR